MSDVQTEQISREEFNQMATQLREVSVAIQELKKAQTPVEKREAKEDVDSAENALRRYAESHGISVADAESALDQVRRNNEKAKVREILEEIFKEDEIAAAEEAKRIEEEKKAGKSKVVDKAKEKTAEKKEGEQQEDSEGQTEHWSERRLFR